ncbi:MAG TPA: hypothetical protein VFU41_16250 [Gemmatimonadales bacterium]|nr:hypothetical protein [Gemmatimonadales bacterium]
MRDLPGWWPLLAALGVAVAFIAAGYYATKRRREAYEVFCLTHGFGYQAELEGYHSSYVDVAALFARNGRCDHFITGRGDGGGFAAFEYSYPVGKSRRSFGVMHWQGEEASLPKFSVAPEGFWQRVGQKLGLQDIDFPEDPDFSGAYQLQGVDEAAIRALFTPAVRRFFAHNRGNHIAGAGRHLFWWRLGTLPRPDELDTFLAEGDGIRRTLVRS